MTLRLEDPGYLHGFNASASHRPCALAGAGSFAGTLVLSGDLLLHSSTAAIISDGHKVMDEAWQIVFRDYLDTTSSYGGEVENPAAGSAQQGYGNTKGAMTIRACSAPG